MNYVAHLFLAEPTDEHRIGSLLADFGVGPLDTVRKRYGAGIAAGVRHHREVDRFTDSHPIVGAAADCLKDDYGLYSAIIVDVVFDHFLLRHWGRFAPMPVHRFFDSVYRSLSRTDWEYPSRYKAAVSGMLEKRWLGSYIELEKVAFALKRIGARLSRPTPLSDTLPGIRHSYETLEACFLGFFPDLLGFSRSMLDADRALSAIKASRRGSHFLLRDS